MVNEYHFDAEGDVCCEHGKAHLLTSRSKNNPDKQYYKCHNYRDGCLFKWKDDLEGSPQKVQPVQPQTPVKRPRADDEPTTDAKRRRFEAIEAALKSPAAKSSSQSTASGSQPRPSQAQRLADKRSQSQSQSLSQSQSQPQSQSQDSQGGFVLQDAQHPSQDESQEQEDTDDGLFSHASPVTPPASQQRYHLPDNHITVKHEEPDSPSPMRTPAHQRQSLLSHPQGESGVDEILSPVKSRLTTLERTKRALEKSNQVKLDEIERLKREVAELQSANAALNSENAKLKVDLEREKKSVNIFQDLLSKKSG